MLHVNFTIFNQDISLGLSFSSTGCYTRTWTPPRLGLTATEFVERAIAKLDDTERGLHEQMAEAATDHARLADLNRELQESERRKAELEDEWMRLATDLEG